MRSMSVGDQAALALAAFNVGMMVIVAMTRSLSAADGFVFIGISLITGFVVRAVIAK